MTRSKSLAVFVFVAACGGSPKQEAVPAAAVEAPEAAVHYKETPPVAVRYVLPEPTAEPAAAACSGAALDLASIAERGECDIEATAAPVPSGLRATLDYDVYQVTEGGRTDVDVVLMNTTAEPVILELDASCAFGNIVDLAVFDHSGLRLDRVSESCEVDAAALCTGHAIRVEIAAGGRAFLRLDVAARVTVVSAECEDLPGRALSPGRYALAISTPLSQRPLRAQLDVIGIERLARSQCERYARRVAAVAEPEDILREEVMRVLARRCHEQPPPRARAECQMRATTAEQLAACEAGE